jgi:hypothetical protein
MGRNRVGESPSLSIPATPGDTTKPSASLTTPSGLVADVSTFVRFLDLVPDNVASKNAKGVGAEDRWELLLPPVTEVGTYVIEFGGDTFEIEVRDEPRRGRQKED